MVYGFSCRSHFHAGLTVMVIPSCVNVSSWSRVIIVPVVRLCFLHASVMPASSLL